MKLLFKKIASALVELTYRVRKNNCTSPLALNGYIIAKNFCNPSEAQRILSKYIQNIKNIPSMESNLGIPFFDPQFMQHFFSSDEYRDIMEYGLSVYGQGLVVQKNPDLVITKPSFTQEKHSLINHDVPASYHSDFPTEISVLIPLTNLTNTTSHTSFCVGSHRAYGIKPFTYYSDREAGKFQQIHLTAKAGDLIAMDVTGIHRAEIVKDSLRIMIQIKFTTAKRVIKSDDIYSLYQNAFSSGIFNENNSEILDDLKYAKNSKYLNHLFSY